MTIKMILRFPRVGSISAQEAVEWVAKPLPGSRLAVGDSRVQDFLVGLGHQWLKPALARRFPELAALGFFLRRAELGQAVASLIGRPGSVRVPRGLVVHFPPSNVETLFVYSWALSALAGNSNIVRLSSRSGALTDTILHSLGTALAEADPAIAQTQLIISYDHDERVTAALSAACDLRVIWGGDQTIDDIRRHLLKPSARDLTFPDRTSFAVVNADGWIAAEQDERSAMVEKFYNDAYWFGQAACSSPRAIFWVGGPQAVQVARTAFHALLQRVVSASGPVLDAAMAIEKRVSTYSLAAEGRAASVQFIGNALTFVELAEPAALPRHWLGTGTFPEARLDSLCDLAPLMTQHDQTITHFGFSGAQLAKFAESLRGYGIDRLVPVGDALRFTSTWDGYDLLYEYTRILTVTS